MYADDTIHRKAGNDVLKGSATGRLVRAGRRLPAPRRSDSARDLLDGGREADQPIGGRRRLLPRRPGADVVRGGTGNYSSRRSRARTRSSWARATSHSFRTTTVSAPSPTAAGATVANYLGELDPKDASGDCEEVNANTSDYGGAPCGKPLRRLAKALPPTLSVGQGFAQAQSWPSRASSARRSCTLRQPVERYFTRRRRPRSRCRRASPARSRLRGLREGGVEDRAGPDAGEDALAVEQPRTRRTASRGANPKGSHQGLVRARG